MSAAQPDAPGAGLYKYARSVGLPAPTQRFLGFIYKRDNISLRNRSIRHRAKGYLYSEVREQSWVGGLRIFAALHCWRAWGSDNVGLGLFACELGVGFFYSFCGCVGMLV